MKDTYIVSSLMSGTSLDGVDLASCRIEKSPREWKYEFISCETVPYPEGILSELRDPGKPGEDDLHRLDDLLGHFYASILNKFHKNRGLKPDFIASHGHTILHEPDKSISFQAGSGSIMARETGLLVVNDFRSEDVRQGGQGAPLVPMGDRLFFSEYGACLNLGGFANISYEDEEGKRVAYDTSPLNMAFNYIAGMKGLEYDEDGKMAARGQIDPGLLLTMNELAYYRQAPPKSLGSEWFRDHFLPLLTQSRLSPEELMATTLEHLACQMTDSITASKASKVLLSGGGALNQSLVKRLLELGSAEIIVPDHDLLNYKEALIFALLGVLKVRGEINVLSSVTGGKLDLSAGQINKP